MSLTYLYVRESKDFSNEENKMQTQMQKNTIKKLLETNKIVVETRFRADENTRLGYRSYYVWIMEDGELDSTCVGSDTLYGDEASDILSRFGYDANSDSVYSWSHSEYDTYKSKEDYDKAGWFFTEEPSKKYKSGKYSATYFLG